MDVLRIPFAAPDGRLPHLLVDWRDASEFAAYGLRTVAPEDPDELLLTAGDFALLLEASIRP